MSTCETGTDASGVGGFSDAFNMLDLGTGCRYCEPADSKDALETLRSIQFMRGDQPHFSGLLG